ncbi:MAG: hypothetical protein ACK4UN_05605 [Limisphaerales bacterium]
MRKYPKTEKQRRNRRPVLVVGRRRGNANQSFELPATPTNLALQEGDSYLWLTWDDVADNEEGYRLYRRAFNGPFEVTAEMIAGQTEFYDGNVEMGVVYTYYLVAFNSAGMSAPSNAVSGEILLVS